WQRGMSDYSTSVFDGLLKLRNRRFNIVVERDEYGRLMLGRRAGVNQQVGDQAVHTLHAACNEFQGLLCVSLQRGGVTAQQHLRINANGAKRLLKIVAGGVSKLLEGLIGLNQRVFEMLPRGLVIQNL